MAIITGMEMKKYGVTANAIAPIARTRLTTDATPATASLMGGDTKDGEFDQFGPQNVAPLVAWLVSDAAAGVNGQVFRVGGRSVYLKDPDGIRVEHTSFVRRSFGGCVLRLSRR